MPRVPHRTASARRWSLGWVLLGCVPLGACTDDAPADVDVPSTTGTTIDTTGTTGATTATTATTPPDAAAVDAATLVDASVAMDAEAAPDGGSGCVPFEMPADCSVPEGAVLPGELRCTGLYGNWEQRELACGVMAYEPAYALWSDAAEKARFVWLPPGTQVDASNPDDFSYPVGTRFWKEFRVGEPGAQRLGETRLLEKGELGWLYTSYVWTEDAQNAIQQNEGVKDLFGTGHEVPTRDECKTCHGGRSDYVLGWDLLMLGPGATGTTREQLVQQGLISGVEPGAMAAVVPGDAVEQAALGYLHANCGISCHNETTFAEAKPSGLYLRLELDDLASVHDTDAVTSGINEPPGPNAELVGLPLSPEQYYDFRPLDPARSLSVARMDFRGSPTAMPPVGTHRVDPEGLALIEAWVESMTEARGYPVAAP